MQSGSKRNFVFQPKIPKISYKKSFETVQGLMWWAVQHKLTFPGVWRYSMWEYNELNTIGVCHFQLSWYGLAFGKRPLMQSVSLPYLHPLSGCLVFFFLVYVCGSLCMHSHKKWASPQNHRMGEVGRVQWRSSGSVPCSNRDTSSRLPGPCLGNFFERIPIRNVFPIIYVPIITSWETVLI